MTGSLLGIADDHPRIPYVPLSDEQQELCRRIIERDQNSDDFAVQQRVAACRRWLEHGIRPFPTGRYFCVI
jgi:hypothetical protein